MRLASSYCVHMKVSPLSVLLLWFMFGFTMARAQFLFEGTVPSTWEGHDLNLSLLTTYRGVERIHPDQFLLQVKVGESGAFSFHGDFLPEGNRMYRLHIDQCSSEDIHPEAVCPPPLQRLFIASNRDTLYFPLGNELEFLCELRSSNPSSSLLIDGADLRDDLLYRMHGLVSASARDLQFERWMSRVDSLYTQSGEPLLALYLLSEPSQPSGNYHAEYLRYMEKTSWYRWLRSDLKEIYPGTDYTRHFEADLSRDGFIEDEASQSGDNPRADLTWVLLFASLGLNVFLLFRVFRSNEQSNRNTYDPLKGLTPREKELASLIVEGKSNKEIATAQYISVSTVKTHINNIYRKLDVQDRNGLKLLLNGKDSREG